MKAVTVFLVLLLSWLPTVRAASPGELAEMPLSDLELHLKSIDLELAQLSRYGLRSGVGSIGFRSGTHKDEKNAEWIKIDLGEESKIDEICLVPTVWRDSESAMVNDAFPAEFHIVAGKSGDEEGEIIARFTAKPSDPVRIAPMAIDCKGTNASWVKIVATKLTTRAIDGKYALQFSEILVFNGEKNLALRKNVTSSWEPFGPSQAWNKQFLVDGFMPYQMNVPRGKQSLPLVSNIDDGIIPTIILDLGSSLPIDEIRIHTITLSDTVPQSILGDFALPKRILIEASDDPDFNNSSTLWDYRWKNIYETGPTIILPTAVTNCRYIRLTGFDLYILDYGEIQYNRMGFAEIEVISKGNNVALNKPLFANFKPKHTLSILSALNDGSNLYGTVLPIRAWLGELSRRHELSVSRPLVTEELQKRYAKQKSSLNLMSWLAAIFAGGIAITILVNRIIRMRHIGRIRMRFAADLHDELGANLHAIGLLGDIALTSMESPDRLKNALRRSRDLTERTSKAVRHCTELQDASGLFGNLKGDMTRTTRRILADLDYEIVIKDEDILDNLKPRTRSDLFLFYKESLVNISRHSGATKLNVSLSAPANTVLLTITDNGQGFEESENVPPSLVRRARLLDATVSIIPPPSGGTCVSLKMRRQRFGIKK
ncbi:MAG: histidine kinase [Luteolibacter sp.]